ncbi:MAG: Eco57I restriction-modification methylase domain-containing protein, partial [Thermodesulfobacteriota bacterium]|nr:Eco57I restriction-modification methylase domain-containing protein [Thermodesulfobacteriota bacterium]
TRERGFRGDESYGKHRGIDYLMRYKKYFKDPDAFLEMVNKVVPFLNGGLFECLDDKDKKIYIDGFSDNMSKTDGKINDLIVPDYLFFGHEEKTDLSADYGTKNKGTKEAAVKGLINILKSYKFTIAENTPIEEDVALDPELLGKVFENLLASYNPETKTTARKQTGSFYTPREIVNYMVDESLIAHLKNSVSNWDMEEKELDEKLHQLLSFESVNPFEHNTKEIIHSLDNCKILDPACGSGAFPMGILQKMVHILQKVDPDNEYWQDLQLEKAQRETEDIFVIKNKEEREQRLLEINEAFDETINNPDYARKLFLIENCIYGVDIQPIAAQISKLRFFISLVVEQKVNKEKENFGIRPLPNLETKFVTANTLIGIDKPDGELFYTKEVQEKEAELKAIRHKLFGAKTKATKVKYRKKDEELRNEIADILKKGNLPVESAEQLAGWDPYDQNGVSPFFDPEWMFDIKDGFDIVIGNPPYVQIQKFSGQQCQKDWQAQNFKTFVKTGDIYSLFYEKGNMVLRDGGILTFITSNKWMRANYGKATRKYFIDCVNIIQII